MNNEYYNLDNPVEQIIRHVIVKFKINDIMINPFNSATIYVTLYDIKDEGVATQILLMEGYEYDQWGSSDEYLIDWTKRKIEQLYPSL